MLVWKKNRKPALGPTGRPRPTADSGWDLLREFEWTNLQYRLDIVSSLYFWYGPNHWHNHSCFLQVANPNKNIAGSSLAQQPSLHTSTRYQINVRQTVSQEFKGAPPTINAPLELHPKLKNFGPLQHRNAAPLDRAHLGLCLVDVCDELCDM